MDDEEDIFVEDEEVVEEDGEDSDPDEVDVFEAEFGDGIDTAEELLKREKDRVKSERRARREKNKTTYYVDPDELLQQIRDFYASDKPMPVTLAENIRKITDRLCFMPKFINYTFRDEMAADAFLKAYQVIFYKKFNPDLGFSPFNYISKVAERACVHRIMMERAEHQAMYDYREVHYDQVRQENTGGE
jgi:hypothetical protein